MGWKAPSLYLWAVHVVSVINQKGGVGKTTSCANIGAALARDGYRVLLIDLDPQAHLSISFDRIPQQGEPSSYTLLSGEHDLADAVQPTGVEGLDIAATNLDLSGAETEFAGEIGRETLLRDALDSFERRPESPEVVLLDCPPSLGLLSLNALVASRHVLIPIQAEFFALQGLAQLLDVVERVKRRLNPRLELTGILVGMYAKQRNLSREVLHELREHFSEKLLDTLVRVNVRLAEAPSHGLTIFDYAPESGGAEDFRAAARELAARLGMAPPRARPDGAPAAVEAQGSRTLDPGRAVASAAEATTQEQQAG